MKSSLKNMTGVGLLSCFTSTDWETENGETLYGLFLLSSFPTLAEIAAFSGYEFVVVNIEPRSPPFKNRPNHLIREIKTET
ncbi:hypothetical protein Hanom_Chr12g01118201 [Helianthus anomalus]